MNNLVNLVPQNNVSLFTHEKFGELRVVTKDGEPWFVAADVCKALEINNSRQAIVRLDEDEKGVISTDTPGGKQEMSIVSEPGLYALKSTQHALIKQEEARGTD